MANLTSFVTTASWQELTGVTEVSDYFTLQNVGGNDFYLYKGTTAVDDDAVVVTTLGKQGNRQSCIIDNVTVNEKVWVKQAGGSTRIAIVKG